MGLRIKKPNFLLSFLSTLTFGVTSSLSILSCSRIDTEEKTKVAIQLPSTTDFRASGLSAKPDMQILSSQNSGHSLILAFSRPDGTAFQSFELELSPLTSTIELEVPTGSLIFQGVLIWKDSYPFQFASQSWPVSFESESVYVLNQTVDIQPSTSSLSLSFQRVPDFLTAKVAGRWVDSVISGEERGPSGQIQVALKIASHLPEIPLVKNIEIFGMYDGWFKTIAVSGNGLSGFIYRLRRPDGSIIPLFGGMPRKIEDFAVQTNSSAISGDVASVWLPPRVFYRYDSSMSQLRVDHLEKQQAYVWGMFYASGLSGVSPKQVGVYHYDFSTTNSGNFWNSFEYLFQNLVAVGRLSYLGGGSPELINPNFNSTINELDNTQVKLGGGQTNFFVGPSFRQSMGETVASGNQYSYPSQWYYDFSTISNTSFEVSQNQLLIPFSLLKTTGSEHWSGFFGIFRNVYEGKYMAEACLSNGIMCTDQRYLRFQFIDGIHSSALSSFRLFRRMSSGGSGSSVLKCSNSSVSAGWMEFNLNKSTFVEGGQSGIRFCPNEACDTSGPASALTSFGSFLQLVSLAGGEEDSNVLGLCFTYKGVNLEMPLYIPLSLVKFQ